MEAFLRTVYRDGAATLEQEAQLMLQKGGNRSDVAAWVVNARNRLKSEIRNLDLTILKRFAELRNKMKYSGAVNPALGPDIPYLLDRGKSYSSIIEGGGRTSGGVSSALGQSAIPTDGAHSSGGSVALTTTQKTWVGRLRLCGRIMMFVDIGLVTSSYYRATSIERPRIFLREGSRIVGAFVGAWTVGAIASTQCALIGAVVSAPVAGVGAVPAGAVCGLVVGISSLAGGLLGGHIGDEVGTWLADQLYPISQTCLSEDA